MGVAVTGSGGAWGSSVSEGQCVTGRTGLLLQSLPDLRPPPDCASGPEDRGRLFKREKHGLRRTQLSSAALFQKALF